MAAKRKATQHVDPIKAEVVARYLLATSEEMGATLMRTAFSPNIKERADCSTAIFDAQGQVIALAQRVPIHLGSMVGAVDEILKRYPRNEILPGDQFVANDPYNGGGTHLPDINIIAPVFIGRKIVAFVANIAHHADVGGMVPGSEAAVCKSIYQEGLRIPPVRIMREGKVNRDVFDIILLNSRTPDERVGDLQGAVRGEYGRRAQRDCGCSSATACTRPQRRSPLISISPRNASARRSTGCRRAATKRRTFSTATTRRASRRSSSRSPSGAGRLDFDFAGSDRQLESARNIPYRALLATVYTVAKSLLDPEVPANAGYYRTLNISAPPGSVVGPVPPAAIGCRSISASVLGDVIAKALSQAMPDKALAGSGPHHLYVLSGTDPRTGRYFVNYETLAGGMGARANRDGVDGVRVHASGSSNLPVEALEHAYPFRVERYALWEDSAGAGRYRGGMGVMRDYRVLGDDIVVSLSSERQHVAAPGAKAGGAGALGAFVLNPGTPEERKLPSAAADVRLPRGSLLRICTPAGAGYGESRQRDRAAIERDVREERISTDAARDVYRYKV